MGGGQRAATPGCEGASLCGMVWGVVGLLMGGGVRSRLSPAWCLVLPDEEEPELIAMLSFLALGHRWPWGVPAQDREK